MGESCSKVKWWASLVWVCMVACGMLGMVVGFLWLTWPIAPIVAGIGLGFWLTSQAIEYLAAWS
jgi:uncharacterized membrane protein HdeD (DUF308 family)